MGTGSPPQPAPLQGDAAGSDTTLSRCGKHVTGTTGWQKHRQHHVTVMPTPADPYYPWPETSCGHTGKPHRNNLSCRHWRKAGFWLCHPHAAFPPPIPESEELSFAALQGKQTRGEDTQQHHSYLILQRNQPSHRGASRASKPCRARMSLETLPCTPQSHVSPGQPHNLAGISRHGAFHHPRDAELGSVPQGQEGAEPFSPGALA